MIDGSFYEHAVSAPPKALRRNLRTPVRPTWTQERVAFALALWEKGYSASAVADGVNQEFGMSVTRNSVIGISDREGFPSHRVNRKPQRRNPPPRQIKLKPPPLLQLLEQTPAAIPASSVLFLDIAPGQCQFPLWGEGVSIFDRRCCGHPADASSPYCAEHHARCHVPSHR